MSVTGELASLVMAANSSAPAPAPMPDDTEDVVEAYSFNTGMFLDLHALVMHSPLCNASISHAPLSRQSTHQSSEIDFPGAGLMVLLMVLWSAVGHQVASRY